MDELLPGLRKRLKVVLEKAFDHMIQNAESGSSWEEDIDVAASLVEDAVAKELVGLTTIFAAKLHDELASFENGLLEEFEGRKRRKAISTEVKRRAMERLLKIPSEAIPMTTKSNSIGSNAGKPILAPYIVDIPLKKKHPNPSAEWGGVETGRCSRCNSDVWMHDQIKSAIQHPNVIGLCEDCAKVERDKQSGN